MATTTETASVPVTSFIVGQTAKFKGYAELADGQEEIFAPDEEVTVTAIDEAAGTITIASLDGARADTAFSDELHAPEPVEQAKPARTRSKPAATPAAAPAKAAEPAKAPSKASPAVKAAADKAEAAHEPKKGKGKAAPAAETPALKTPSGKGSGKKAANLATAAASAKAPKAKAEKAPKAPKAVPQKKAEPVAEEPVEVVQTEALAGLLADTTPLEAARSLINESEETFFTLGGVLAEIYHSKAYAELGGEYAEKQGWSLYLERELGIGYRKGMNLIEIYMGFTKLDVDEKRLSAVGWSKARELVKALTPENVEELLTYAAEHNKEDTINYVKTTYPVTKDENGKSTATPAERTKKVAYKFKLFEAEAETANAAIDLAKKRGETTDLSQAMSLIFTEWSQLSGATQTTLLDDLTRLDAKFGTHLTAYLDENGNWPEDAAEDEGAAEA